MRLVDVAARAGVAASTASAALNGGVGVSAATLSKVLRAADDLRYSGPDPRARALRLRRSRTICVVPDPALIEEHPKLALRVLQDIGECVGAEGGFVLWLSPCGDLRDQLRRAPVDGVVIVGKAPREVRHDLRSRAVPHLIINPHRARDVTTRREICGLLGWDGDASIETSVPVFEVRPDE